VSQEEFRERVNAVRRRKAYHRQMLKRDPNYVEKRKAEKEAKREQRKAEREKGRSNSTEYY
jgi:hypothetical protein